MKTISDKDPMAQKSVRFAVAPKRIPAANPALATTVPTDKSSMKILPVVSPSIL
ncbi:MAG: hypothetical protein QGI42_00045 [Rhodospirillales bacterium]|jgi:hypothetical protein|nr:hypothetical protein [Rhodospirillales bacterium]HIJ44313.1 hypothetical protein [Rhodospirillaceae bacterium]